ncbi:aldehyde dehydrogenase family protein [Agrobacterium radiobacter]|uniref:aldehyde dehydrogenase family protein n=1 Tax=Agrobacterium radiobacter TaxID=362 RepID=UPI0003790669|nr:MULTISPECIES: aldehyde dehydrogenase family protein [Agrobacterium tumefaciens complex]EPR23305.1 succinate-semialdehyde dehdyrogenase [Agrobacterium radiobacter DSM 30147]KAB0459236.1 aldehyde dehydrogenase family protein [Agrobacterium tumefaciens]KWT75438.1 aldehyde dehydrogenase [Agrobacterium radiobacter]NIB11651.1 aldehyde dehydrogenase family protein [Agrobacterium radiobacter]OOO33159.1 aldehyde dehydrogenase family protein [Agrobacterium radiobacter]
MRNIDKIYIDGQFVTPKGTEMADLHNPSTEEKIGTVQLAGVEDAREAIAAAKRAFPPFSRTSKAERVDMLKRLNAAVAARVTDLTEAMSLEYGAPQTFTRFAIPHAASSFLTMASVLEDYEFERQMGRARVVMQPSGVAAAITPWNSNIGFITSKLATAIAAGSTIVIKPSEMSAIQTQILTECLHVAGLPKGAFNIVNGFGNVVGAELSRHPDVAKVTFTGSTAVGREILRNAADTFKRVTLELGGKGPNIILEDADLDIVIPAVLRMGFINSGQACIAGTRILVPNHRLDDVLVRLKQEIETFKVGAPSDPDAMIGPMVSRKQYDRVQSYIELGTQEGARLLTGGMGRPAGLDRGWFTKPTIFFSVDNQMRIAREEIFGPVLSVIAYRDEDEAVSIANDTPYGLQAYLHGTDSARMQALADRLDSGRVVINGAPHEPLAPFGGFKQSGIGREYGVFGLEAFLEPKAVIG